MEDELIFKQDPLSVAIADARVLPRSVPPLGPALIMDIHLDRLARRMKAVLNPLFRVQPRLRDFYVGATQNIVDAEVGRDVDHMVDAMMSVTYNRLRNVLELNNPPARPTRMNHRSPVNSRLEFPAFLASMLSNIGPLRITDAARDILVVYATTADQMQTYGRAAVPPFDIGRHIRFNNALRACKVRLTPIDVYQQETASFFTTMTPTLDNDSWSFYAEMHPSHYENEDIVRAYTALDPDINNRPFEFCGTAVDFCTNAAVVAAVVAARPAQVAAAVDGATAPTDPVGFNFPTNIFGVRPAVAGADGAQITPAGVYILGRGNDIHYRTLMAHRLTTSDLNNMLLYRLFH